MTLTRHGFSEYFCSRGGEHDTARVDVTDTGKQGTFGSVGGGDRRKFEPRFRAENSLREMGPFSGFRRDDGVLEIDQAADREAVVRIDSGREDRLFHAESPNGEAVIGDAIEAVGRQILALALQPLLLFSLALPWSVL
jgi:hypothetical protein